MKRLFLVLPVILLAATLACSSGTAPTPTSLPAAPAATATSAPVGPAATGTPAGPSATAFPTPTETPAAFFLDVTSPENESVIRAATIEVKGRTAVDAVVSVNDTVVDVAEDGSFTSMVTLGEGPNTIDVIASDFSGDQQAKIINVIYVP